MEFMLTLAVAAVFVLGVLLANTRQRLTLLEKRSEELDERLHEYAERLLKVGKPKPEAVNEKPAEAPTHARKAAEQPAERPAERSVAKLVVNRADTSTEQRSAVITETPSPAPDKVAPDRIDDSETSPSASEESPVWQRINKISELSFEDLIGGKLPIWIGGVALIFAGFFMVRYSIEQGLVGPGARTVMASIFGLLLVTLSEAGSRLPKIGHVFSEDKRIRQSLAGAGVAILYATLYMASELYGLIGLGTSFALVVAVTVLAFILSLRHGPPTAVMGIIGGFVAPWVAQMGAENMPALLIYLSIFIGAVFGLAIWQRWLWLLLLATGGGAIWTFALVLSAETGLPLLGLFITVLGAAAVFSILRTKSDNPRFEIGAVFASLGLAMLQLTVLIPRMDFSPLGWAFVAALSIISLILAWRDTKLLPLASMAGILALVPIISAWGEVNNANSVGTILATIAYAILFGGAGQVWLWTKGQSRIWALLALFAPFASFITARSSSIDPFITDNYNPLTDAGWSLLALAITIPTASVAWCFRNEETPLRPIGLLAVAITGLMLFIGFVGLMPESLVPLIFVIIAGAITCWAFYINAASIRRLGYLPMGLGALAMLLMADRAIEAMATALFGEFSIYENLPALTDLAIEMLLPAVLMIAASLLPKIGLGQYGKRVTFALGSIGAGIFLWLCAKQIFQISTVADFIQYGFAERMLITLVIAVAGLAAIWWERGKESTRLQHLGMTLLALTLFRFVWFDLIAFNPMFEAQQLGPAPVANLGVVLGASLAITFWLASKWMPDRYMGLASRRLALTVSLGITIITILTLVRQSVHGSVIANAPVGTGENYLYSVALLLLAIAWLTRGILTGSRYMRLAGLGLLTATTLKVFFVDAGALEGILRILSFLGLGIALIGIGWAYGRLMRSEDADSDSADTANNEETG